MSEVEALAAQMYTQRCVPQGPPWDQLGEVTRSVWLEKAEAILYEDIA